MDTERQVRRMQVQAAAASYCLLDQLDQCRTSAERIAVLSQLWLTGFAAGAQKAEEILLK